jgi:hypothetical protein
MKGLKIAHTKQHQPENIITSDDDSLNIYSEFKKTSKKLMRKLNSDSKEDLSIELGYLESLLPETPQIYEIGPEEGDIIYYRGKLLF